jgi:hypothetical protein
MRLWELCRSTDLNPPEVMMEARDLQALISRADWAASNANVGWQLKSTWYCIQYEYITVKN